MNDGHRLPVRSTFRNAHAYLPAPYGVYDTADGYLALAMNSLSELGSLLEMPELVGIEDAAVGFRRRDEIKQLLAQRLREATTEHWLRILEPADVWCAEVLDWPNLLSSDAMRQLQMIQKLTDCKGNEILTTRCPIRLDHTLLTNSGLAPKVGEHTVTIQQEFGL
jgi:crotonobetainyl-CoA:carnitine CoA-transferase CaiB-like acyl-CoA transferase